MMFDNLEVSRHWPTHEQTRDIDTALARNLEKLGGRVRVI